MPPPPPVKEAIPGPGTGSIGVSGLAADRGQPSRFQLLRFVHFRLACDLANFVASFALQTRTEQLDSTRAQSDKAKPLPRNKRGGQKKLGKLRLALKSIQQSQSFVWYERFVHAQGPREQLGAPRVAPPASSVCRSRPSLTERTDVRLVAGAKQHNTVLLLAGRIGDRQKFASSTSMSSSSLRQFCAWSSSSTRSSTGEISRSKRTSVSHSTHDCSRRIKRDSDRWSIKSGRCLRSISSNSPCFLEVLSGLAGARNHPNLFFPFLISRPKHHLCITFYCP